MPGNRSRASTTSEPDARSAPAQRRASPSVGESEGQSPLDKNVWRDRRVFVTGATGLVGASLVRQLLESGADVVALIRDWVPGSELVGAGLVERINIVRGDVRDQRADGARAR